MHDLADFHDNPSDTGGPFENQEEAAPEDTDAEKGFVTIGQFEGGQPGAGGVAWQWCSERLLEGFLYGELDTAGTFTGPKESNMPSGWSSGRSAASVLREVCRAKHALQVEQPSLVAC